MEIKLPIRITRKILKIFNPLQLTSQHSHLANIEIFEQFPFNERPESRELQTLSCRCCVTAWPMPQLAFECAAHCIHRRSPIACIELWISLLCGILLLHSIRKVRIGCCCAPRADRGSAMCTLHFTWMDAWRVSLSYYRCCSNFEHFQKSKYIVSLPCAAFSQFVFFPSSSAAQKHASAASNSTQC